ncbi:MAG: RHS repeat protein, partial [Lentisphaeria bacterium]|nr:RHS repeat protein [Lentisphaeria bacterium]
WDVLFANLRNRIGPTWGDLVRCLGQDAGYLGTLGRDVVGLDALLGFETMAADGLTPQRHLCVEPDLMVDTPGMPLVLARLYPSSISARSASAEFGRGWLHCWMVRLAEAADGTVTVTMGSDRHVFQPDVRGGYISVPHLPLQLTRSVDGFLLRDPGGITAAFTLDGRFLHLQDPNGYRITAAYNGGRMVRLTHSNGMFLEFAYDGSGRITAATDSLGRSVAYSYAAGQDLLESVTCVDGQTTTYTYDTSGTAAAAGALASVAWTGGTGQTFGYDGNGRLEEIRERNGPGLLRFTYSAPAVVTYVDALGTGGSVSYDDRGRPAITRNGLEEPTQSRVSEDGLSQELLLWPGRRFQRTFDPRGNLLSSRDPLGNLSRFRYEPTLGRMQSFTDAMGRVTTWTCDAAGNLTSTRDALGFVREMTRGDHGLPLSDTNKRGQTTSYVHDGFGHLTRADLPDGSQTHLGYDASGRLASLQDQTGETTFSYTPEGRLAQVLYPGGLSITYSYDGAGRRSRVEDQDGRAVVYQYAANGDLHCLRDETGALLIAYSYDAAGRVVREDRGNGSWSAAEFGPLGQPSVLEHRAADGTPMSRFEYTYNSAGAVASQTTPEGTWTYEYDPLGRLVRAAFAAAAGAALPDRELTFQYDAAGNRVRQVDGPTDTPCTVNSLNQVTQVGAAPLTYDADGNLVEKGEESTPWEYAYNPAGWLTEVQHGGDSWSYTYNALGWRVAVTHNGVTTRLLVDPASPGGLGDVIGEYTPAGTCLATYAYGLGLAARRGPAGEHAYYTTDAAGNTTELTDAGGTVLNRYRYLPFGGSQMTVEAVANPFQYGGLAGVQTDGTGLLFMRARHYDPELGRFLQPDPIGIAGGANLYAYAGNSPLNHADPSGTIFETVTYKQILAIMMKKNGFDATLVDIALKLANMRAMEMERLLSTTGTSIRALRLLYQLRFVQGQNVLLADCIAMVNGTAAAAPTAAAANAAVTTTAASAGAAGGSGAAAGAGGFSYMGAAATAAYTVLIWHGVGYGIMWIGEKTGWDSWEDWGRAMWNVLDPECIGVAWDYWFGDSESAGSQDPNGKTGPGGAGPEGWIAGDQLLPYRIDFENDPGASAPAQVVILRDPLDGNLDWSTLEITEVGFGDHLVVVPPGLNTFETSIAFEQNGMALELEVRVALNPAGGVLEALFTTLDPETGLPPPVDYGFLPPEDGTGRGQGHLSFVVRPKAGLPTGTGFSNVAEITFDFSTTIATNQVDPHDPGAGTDPEKECRLTIDALAPASAVATLPDESPWDFTVTCGGADPHSGIASYTVYVQDNDGPWNPWTVTTDATAVFSGELDHTYRFYCVATDRAGNVEIKAAGAEAETTVTLNRYVT